MDWLCRMAVQAPGEVLGVSAEAAGPTNVATSTVRAKAGAHFELGTSAIMDMPTAGCQV